MAFSDPQTVTVATVAQTLNRTPVLDGVAQGSFVKDDQSYKLEITQSKKGRTSHIVRLSARKIAADPLASANNVEYQMSVTLSVNAPNVGYTATEQKDLIAALAAWLTASTNANAIKLVNFEA